jgi:hypothetical protein
MANLKVSPDVDLLMQGTNKAEMQIAIGLPAVGLDGEVLTADSAEATGLKWSTPAGGGNMLKSVYDPSNKNVTAFSMENMDEGATKKILTVEERQTIVDHTAAIQSSNSDILYNYGRIGLLETDVSQLHAYPYTTFIDLGVGVTKNIIVLSSSSGYVGSSISSVAFGANCTTLAAGAFTNSAVVEVNYNISMTGIIGNTCFQNCANYGSVNGHGFTLGVNISGIGNSSYRTCVSLTSVDLSNYDIGSIGIFAFEGCSFLTDFTFPILTGNTQNLFTIIPESVLRNCIALTEIEIPSQITQIDGAAFNGCTLLTQVRCYATTAPTLVGANHFLGTNATQIRVPTGSEAGWSATFAGLQVVHDL